MPQISQLAATYSSQIFWLLLIFGFVFFAIGLGMFPKVESTVDARDKRISDDLEAAKAASARADELEEESRIQTGEDRAAEHKIPQLAKEQAATAADRRLADADGTSSDRHGSGERWEERGEGKGGGKTRR